MTFFIFFAARLIPKFSHGKTLLLPLAIIKALDQCAQKLLSKTDLSRIVLFQPSQISFQPLDLPQLGLPEKELAETVVDMDPMR